MGAFRKEVLRSITHSWGRFLAIAVMAALGCGFYAGLRMTGPDMRLAGDEYYDATEFAIFAWCRRSACPMSRSTCCAALKAFQGSCPRMRPMRYPSWRVCSTRFAIIRLTWTLRRRAVATMACMCDRTMPTT